MSLRTIALAALFACLVLGQTASEPSVDRVLYYTSARSVQDMQEIATLVRSIGGIGHVTVNEDERTLSLRATNQQIALAEWLFKEVDQPLNPQTTAQPPVKREFVMPGTGENVVRVFYLPGTATVQEFQEVATLIRSIGEIRRAFTYNSARAMALRGANEQMALAEWLVNELDVNRQAPVQPGDALRHEFRMPGGGDDLVRVFYLSRAGTVQRFQQIVTQVRSLTGTRRVFTYNTPRAAAFRGTFEQIARAERLINERDQ